MPIIDGKEYPRLENGVVLHEPARRAEPAAPVTGPDINAATAEELKNMKGVGKKVASAIVAEREENGPFADLADCAERVPGITIKSLEAASAFAGSE